MAESKKKSQAEKAVSATKEKKGSAKTEKKISAVEQLQFNMDSPIVPIRLLAGAGCILFFILLLTVLVRPEGALLLFVKALIYGLFGRVGFGFLIPVSLFFGVLLLTHKDETVIPRGLCAFVFMICCGCISHILSEMPTYTDFFDMFVKLFTGGADGTTGGIICGGIAMILEWLMGPVISIILLVIIGVLTLLAAFQITVPKLVAAFKSRPRADWEFEEKKSKPDPAEVVVHTIAAKRIEYVEQRRKIDAEKTLHQNEKGGRKALPDRQSRVSGLIRQIAGDIERPVEAAGVVIDAVEDEDLVAPEVIDNDDKADEIILLEADDEDPAPAAQEAVIEDEEPEIITQEVNSRSNDDAVIKQEPVAPEKVTAKDARLAASEVAAEIAKAEKEAKPQYCYPPIKLLHPANRGAADGTQEMKENSRRLNETLASFKIDAHIVNVTRGPSVTRYEVELEKGVRLNKLTSAADDIALSLGASGVRIAAVPEKISVVGIEVPNRAVTTVTLREVIDSKEFSSAKSKSSFAVGKDIGGSCIVGNIAKLPHMLIAGTTGSGKSVCMNSIIISLLYKASPDDVKLIMVDPKMVELGIYNGIPHLLIPVVTDPKKAAGSLQWAVTEMLRRYKAMSDMGVRDLESYNSIIESQEIDGERLPQIVVIIDELADLMLVAAKEVEESICRIAQMGRAAGIHLIIATQRPSADVITGLMKANIPSRIAFAVASAMESRIILDTQGAEKLVGRGDMLFAPIGTGKPQRVQGCFVSDDEVEAVATYIKEHYNTNYDQSVMEEIEKKAVQTGNSKSSASDPEPNADELDGDEMLPQAVDVILETGQASVSMLQRRLKLGYARAARIVDEMEEKGIVGPFQGSKPRSILITKAQWEAMRSGKAEQMEFDDLDMDQGVPDDID